MLCSSVSHQGRMMLVVGSARNSRTSLMFRGAWTTTTTTSRRNLQLSFSSSFSFSSSSEWTPMSKEEEELEKTRVAQLSDYQKEMELRQLDRQLATLSMKRGINTGELYTLRGKYKALARDYGMPFMAWYWICWTSTCTMCYSAIAMGLIDTMHVFTQLDSWTGYNLSGHVDPTLGSIGLAIALNELLEPIRLPIVLYTTKPVVHWLGMGPKY